MAPALRDTLPEAVELDGPDGTVTLGVDDGYAGIFPEGLTAEADDWGSSSLSFTLNRPTGLHYPDLADLTEARYYTGGNGTEGSAELRWRGRIAERGLTDDVASFQGTVTCEGTQASLDDDAFVAAWVLADQSLWQDLSTVSDVDLNATDPVTVWRQHGPAQAGQVTAYGSRGAKSLSVPKGTTLVGRQKVGMYLDARRFLSFHNVFLEWYCRAPSAPRLNLVVASAPNPHFITRRELLRTPVTDLGLHDQQRLDPDIAQPMPYLGVFLEHDPPPLTVTGAVGEAGAFTRSSNGAQVAAQGFDVGSGGAQEADLFVLHVAYDGAPTDTTGVTPPSVDWVQLAEGQTPYLNQGAHSPAQGHRWALFARRAPEGYTADGEIWAWAGGLGGAITGVQLYVLRNVVADPGAINVAAAHVSDHGVVSLTAEKEGSVYLRLMAHTSFTNGLFAEANVGASWADHGSGGWLGNDDTHMLGMQVWSDVNVAAHHAGDTVQSTFTFNGYSGAASSGTLAILELPRVPDAGAVDMDAADTYLQDVQVVLARLKVAPDGSLLYANGDSQVPPERVVTDALRFAVQLSQDTSLISVAGADLEQLVLDTPTTPRDAIQAADALTLFRKRVELDGRLRYGAFPDTALVELGDWDGWGFEDATGSSLRDTFNGAFIAGQDPLGRPVLAKRGAYAYLPTPATQQLAASTVDGAGWGYEGDADGEAVLGSAAYDSAVHQDGAQSLRLTASAPEAAAAGSGVAVWMQTLGHAFSVGVEYVLRLAVRRSAALWTDGVQGQFRLGVYGRNWRYLSREDVLAIEPAGSWVTLELPFVAVDPNMHLHLIAGARGDTPQDVLWLDALEVWQVMATELDAIGVRRTKTITVSNALNPAVAERVARVNLQSGARPQFKGSLTITGPAARLTADHSVRVPAAALLDMAGELISLPTVHNPWTGTLGRTGRVVAVSYDAATDTATVSLDNDAHALERLQASLDAKAGR